MKTRTVTLLTTCALATLAGCARPEPEIERASVEHIITTLAADDMQGRRSFTPYDRRAADFVAGEFERIGLEPLDGANDYLQRFPMYSISVESQSITLNGRAVPAERAAIALAADSIHWTPDDDVEVVVIGPDDNPMQMFSAVRRGGVNSLVLMSRRHQNLFDRVKRFMGGPSRISELGSGTSTVFVLTDESRATTFDVRATATVEQTELANVVGLIPGKRPDEIVLFSAHHDHVGVGEPVEGDSVFNGANDDASGVTAVIELARYFKALGRPERTLMFATFTAEEMGGYGADHLANTVDPDKIVAMFNIEMIGKVAADGPNSAWITGFDKSDFGEILAHAVEGTGFTFAADPYPDENLFLRSDNATFARLGVPAHSISSTPIDVDQDYHRVTDEVETLDLEHMTNTIRAIARAARPIVSGEMTPTRIDPATLN